MRRTRWQKFPPCSVYHLFARRPEGARFFSAKMDKSTRGIVTSLHELLRPIGHVVLVTIDILKNCTNSKLIDWIHEVNPGSDTGAIFAL